MISTQSIPIKNINEQATVEVEFTVCPKINELQPKMLVPDTIFCKILTNNKLKRDDVNTIFNTYSKTDLAIH